MSHGCVVSPAWKPAKNTPFWQPWHELVHFLFPPPPQSLRFSLGGGGANFNFVGLNWSASPNFGQRFGCNLGWRILSEGNFQKDPQAKFGRTEKGKVSFAGILG